VDDAGCLAHTTDLPADQQMPAEMLGKSILEKHGKSDANDAVLHELRVRNALAHQENYHHSYPHCWRSKTPIIFRAMDQWFIKVDHADNSAGFTLRNQALRAIQSKIKWIPEWGQNRIEGAVMARPDWCISRQRCWGVPVPDPSDVRNRNKVKQVIEKVARLVELHGSNIWFEKSTSELWQLCKPDEWNGQNAASKSADTLDVWIDSGSSSRTVLKCRPELQHDLPGPDAWRADVYLEGSDQHRGWFQSSLLLSLATNRDQGISGQGVPPFHTVLTHGFMVDEDREKISKSKQGQGGYTKPQTADRYVNEYGADVLRLWVASQDYRNDIVVSEERLKKVSETYRGIRNTLRYQLSNLYDFDPAQHTVPDAQLTGLDRWVLGEFAKLEEEVRLAYEGNGDDRKGYEFHVVYQKLSQFVAVELSSIYHDVVKDRLYTDPANSARRRSTQTALHRMVTRLCQMLAPILAFTADEAWEFIPGKPTPSVHLSEWEPKEFKRFDTWNEVLMKTRQDVLKALENARQTKLIGKSLDASLVWKVGADTVSWVEIPKDTWREIFNVSDIVVQTALAGDGETVTVLKAAGQKCERCWHWETEVGANTEHPTLCPRCVEAVKQCAAA
jgi:isoleucyl-tRNA synthetase